MTEYDHVILQAADDAGVSPGQFCLDELRRNGHDIEVPVDQTYWHGSPLDRSGSAVVEIRNGKLVLEYDELATALLYNVIVTKQRAGRPLRLDDLQPVVRDFTLALVNKDEAKS